MYVSDMAMLGAVGTAAWQVFGTWLKFKSGRSKRNVQQGPFEEVGKALRATAAKGVRTSPDWGHGAVESGHAHVVAGWNSLSAETRAAMVEDLLQVAVLTGQLNHIKAVREGRTKWSQLKLREQGQVLAALDALTLDSLGTALQAAGPQLAKSWLWQVTEAVPMLSEERNLRDPCVAELSKLTKAFDKADAAVKDVLTAERARLLGALSSSLTPLDLSPATAQLKELKGVLTSDLANELGAPGKARAVHALRTTLAALAAEQDGGLLPAAGTPALAGVSEAARKLTAQVDAQVSDAVAAKEKAAAEAGAAAEVAHLVQVASTPSYWAPGVSAVAQVALVNALLARIAATPASTAPSTAVVDAARKLIPKIALPEGVDEDATAARDGRVTHLLAALTPAPAPAPTESAVEGDEEVPPAPAPPAPQVAASELASLVATALPAPAASATTDDGDAAVSALISKAFAAAVIATTPGGALAAAAAGVSGIQASEVLAAVEADVLAKGEAVRKPLLDTLTAELPSLRRATTTSLLTARVAELNKAQEGADADEAASAVRLALVAAYLREVVLPGPDSGLGAGLKSALDLVRPQHEGALLSSGGAAAVLLARQLMAQVALCQDLSTGLELGPGVVSLLDRVQDFVATPAPTAPPAAAATDGSPQGDADVAQGNGDVAAGDEEEDGAAAPQANGHHPEAKAAAVDDVARTKVGTLVAGLLSSGLVLLELSTSESRKLGLLRSASEGAEKAGSDALVFNKHLGYLKELSTQLGPIMGALEAKVGSAATPERRAALQGVRDSAVAAYKALQGLLSLENTARTATLDAMNEVKDVVYGLKPAPNSAGLETGLAKLEGVRAKAEGVMGHVAALPGGEDAMSEVMVMEEQVNRVSGALRMWADWVRLRELCLGVTPASAAAPEDGADIELPPISDLQVTHADDQVTFIDLYGVGEGEDEEGDAPPPEDMSAVVAAASTRTQGDEEERMAARQAAAIARVEAHQSAGYRLIARGQVAVVLTVSGAPSGGELRATKDVGLPSTKSPLQLFAERVIKAQQLAASAVFGAGAGVLRPLDVYLLCPQSSLSSLRTALEEASYYGLLPGQVYLVPSDVSRPALTADLKVAMEAPGRIAKSAPCSGDVWVALKAAGALGTIRARGARFVEVHTLDDNLMVRPADPVFIGCCARESVDAAAKVGDPASLLTAYEGYAQLVATTRGAAGFSRLVPALGSYCFSAFFLKQVEAELKANPLALYRLSPAAPRAPAAPAAKAAAPVPTAAVAYQLDRHLSDWVVASGLEDVHPAVVFVQTEDEFAPAVGNPPLYIPPAPTHAVDNLLLQHTSWVEASGGELADPEEGVVEVAPLVSYAGEGLEPLVAGKTFTEAYELDLQGYAPEAGRKLVMPNALLTLPVLALWVGLGAMKLVKRE